MTGFVSEIFICRAGIDTGGAGILFVFLMLANIVISLGYYIPSINTIMFSTERGPGLSGMRPVPFLMQAMILAATLLVLLLGIFPQLGLSIVSPAATFLQSRFFPV
jgi:NADH:ubiquinone oxidoreductase subunit 2 (subunit N)